MFQQCCVKSLLLGLAVLAVVGLALHLPTRRIGSHSRQGPRLFTAPTSSAPTESAQSLRCSNNNNDNHNSKVDAWQIPHPPKTPPPYQQSELRIPPHPPKTPPPVDLVFQTQTQPEDQLPYYPNVDGANGEHSITLRNGVYQNSTLTVWENDNNSDTAIDGILSEIQNGLLPQKTDETKRKPLLTAPVSYLERAEELVAAAKVRAAATLSGSAATTALLSEEQPQQPQPSLESDTTTIPPVVASARGRRRRNQNAEDDEKSPFWIKLLSRGDFKPTRNNVGDAVAKTTPSNGNSLSFPTFRTLNNGRDTTTPTTPTTTTTSSFNFFMKTTDNEKAADLQTTPQSPDDAFFSNAIQPGVSRREIQGAALAGLAVAFMLHGPYDEFHDLDGGFGTLLWWWTLPAVTTSYLAVTKGSVGGLARVVGRWTSDVTDLVAVALDRMVQVAVQHDVADVAWMVTSTTARHTQRAVRQAAVFVTEYHSLREQRERSVRTERSARNLLQYRLAMEATARIGRAAATQRARDAAAVQQERDRIRTERRTRENGHVQARRDLMRHRFDTEAKERRTVLVAKQEVQKRVTSEMKMAMEKTALKRTQEAEERRFRDEEQRAFEHAAAEKVRLADQLELTQLKDRIRRRLNLRSRQEVFAHVAQRARQIQRFVQNCARNLLATRYTLVHRAAIYLVAASAPIFVLMQAREDQASEGPKQKQP